MKTKPLLTILLACSILTFAQAQENQPAKTYKNDIGVNASSLMPGIFNNTAPVAILYKRYTSENRAIRFGLAGSASSSKVDNASITANYTNQSSTSFSFLVGKEFQKHINQKWTWYYGGDLVPFYNYTHSKTYNNGVQNYDSEILNFGMSFRAFLGIRYNINSRLYVSAESSLQVSNVHNKSSTRYWSDSFNSSSDTSGSSYSATLTPSTGIFLFYRF